MKILEDYDTFKYKLLKNKFGYKEIEEKSAKMKKGPEEIIREKYNEYKKRNINLSKIEIKQLKNNF